MRWAFLLSLLMFVSPATAAEPLQLHAAGSLRAALNEVIEAFTAKTSVQVQATYAPSGLLRERIAGGEASDLSRPLT